MAKNPLLTAIEEKTLARERALKDARELESQIKTLQEALTLTQPTAYEQFLKAQSAPVLPKTDQEEVDTIPKNDPKPSISEMNAADYEKIPKTRRGELRGAIVSALKTDATMNIDQVYELVHTSLGTATSRESVRATLGLLKNTGKVESPSYGSYRLPQSETPTSLSVGVSVPTSPNQGAN